MAPIEAAIQGTREVGGPVIFSDPDERASPSFRCSSSPERPGKFWRPLPIVVIVVLLLSLIEALFILPAHLASSAAARKTSRRERRLLHAGQQLFHALLRPRGGARLPDRC